MLDAILDIIKNGWDSLKFCQILYEYEEGVVYYKGTQDRLMKTGINWKIPIVEVFHFTTTQDDTKQLKQQTINNRTVIPNIVFYVYDVRKWSERVTGEDERIVYDICAAEVAEGIRKGCKRKVMLKSIRERCSIYGYRVRSLTFVTDSEMPTIRLIHDNEVEF